MTSLSKTSPSISFPWSETAIGWLEPGIYDCSLEQARVGFGSFQDSDWRPKLFDRLRQFIADAKQSGVVTSVIVDGSFVSTKPRPSDIDIIVITNVPVEQTNDLPPYQANVISAKSIKRRYGFDVLVALHETPSVERAIDVYREVKGSPGVEKGMIRIVL
jgi:predicted nucleotidyltransferase